MLPLTLPQQARLLSPFMLIMLGCLSTSQDLLPHFSQQCDTLRSLEPPGGTRAPQNLEAWPHFGSCSSTGPICRALCPSSAGMLISTMQPKMKETRAPCMCGWEDSWTVSMFLTSPCLGGLPCSQKPSEDDTTFAS